MRLWFVKDYGCVLAPNRDAITDIVMLAQWGAGYQDRMDAEWIAEERADIVDDGYAADAIELPLEASYIVPSHCTSLEQVHKLLDELGID
jgi:hypothetical protein